MFELQEENKNNKDKAGPSDPSSSSAVNSVNINNMNNNHHKVNSKPGSNGPDSVRKPILVTEKVELERRVPITTPRPTTTTRRTTTTTTRPPTSTRRTSASPPRKSVTQFKNRATAKPRNQQGSVDTTLAVAIQQNTDGKREIWRLSAKNIGFLKYFQKQFPLGA